MVKTWNQLPLETRLSAQERYEELRKEVAKLAKRVKDLESKDDTVSEDSKEEKQ